ncbi:MAG: hypothetical protein ABSC07_17510 [Terriglobales bacterium]|jgi:hypothetical protein
MVCIGRVVRAVILVGMAMTTLVYGKTNNGKTSVTYPSAFGVSEPISELPINQSLFSGKEMPEPRPGPLRSKTNAGPGLSEDPVLQKKYKPQVGVTQGVSFDGIASPGYVPSDSNMAVGPNAIVEVVNVQLAVYGKSGALVAGPTNIQSLFSSLKGDCSANTYGDPIVLYDRLADRWVVTMLGAGSTYSECVAVSQTNDPAGAYYLYGYSFGANLNDYDKLSVWPTASNSAYLATYNLFQNAENFVGASLCGFDRTKMLTGDPTAAQLCQTTPDTEFGYLPSDLDGATPPDDGTPGLFLSWQNNDPGQLYLRKLTLNFAAGTSTLSAPTTISVANDNLACSDGGTCVPQLGTTQTLDSLGDRLMYRFAVRRFSDHDRAVVNHAVANGSEVAVRWYEIYDPAGTVTLNQQGTFAPNATYRWMASMAEDQNKDIGLGYSASSSSIHPAIRFTGRVPSDPLGTMESEATILTGTGSQTPSANAGNRWGDYTAMVVDPSDDCTFWYVDQYQSVNGVFDWQTNIASFNFDGCTGAPQPGFSLSPSSSAVTIAKNGASGTSTITITPVNGFTGSVTLVASGLPKGVTASFNPNPATSSSVLTLTASSTAKVGTATVTITGTSGSLVETTTISLTVDALGGFSLAALPKVVTVAQGSSGTSTITIKPTAGFDQDVTLSASGVPSGVTASFSADPSTSTSTLNLEVSDSAAVGKSTITITGTFGSLTRKTTVMLKVTAP